MAVVLLMICLLCLRCFCCAQDLPLNDADDFDSEDDIDDRNCSCIETYYELESYVKGNRDVIENLKSGFFATGKPPAKFVKLTYNFQVSNDTCNSTDENDVMNCSNHQTKYIWSEQFLYLLGPRALLWFTLFAVRIPENEVTIDLPCLCHGVYDNLLSRLTYMSKVYAAVEYYEQPLEFISHHYFQAKDNKHGEYQNVTFLMFALSQFPFFGMPFISIITVNYVYPKILLLMEQYQAYMTDHNSLPLSSVNAVFYFCIFKTSVPVTLLLVISQVGSIVESIDYGNEVLSDDDHNMPYVHAVFSSIAIATWLAPAYVLITYNAMQYCRHQLLARRNKVISILISVNVFYILCYFCLYMLLAFLDNPLVTFSTYFIIIIAIFGWFHFLLMSIILASIHVLKVCRMIANQSKAAKLLISIFMYLTGLIAGCISIYGFVLIMLYVAAILVNFTSSQLSQVILISFLVGLISFLLLKPANKKAHTHAMPVDYGTISTEHEETQINDTA